MLRRRRRMKDNPTDPELPITPMLDMSFQLMAFFILTFKPGPTEGQLAMTLPSEGTSIAAPSLNPPTEPKYSGLVRLVGGVVDFTLMMPGEPRPIPFTGPDGKPVKLVTSTTGSNINTDQLVVELKKIMARAVEANKSLPPDAQTIPKLEFQFEDDVKVAIIVRLLDEARRAGFNKVTPMPLANAWKGGG